MRVAFLIYLTKIHRIVDCFLRHRVLRKSVIPVGALITSVSLIAMIHSMDDPVKIGPSIAVSLLAVVYALIAYFILFLLELHRK